MSSTVRTVGDVANDIRRRRLSADEAAFSRMLLSFAARLLGTYQKQAASVLIRLATTKDNRERQLALVWLDSAGYSTLPMDVLVALVRQLRDVPDD